MRRRGVAYVECVLQPKIRWIEGHWEPPEAAAVEGPRWIDREEAISWGRKRAPGVYLRLHRATFSYRYYRAGHLMVKLNAPPSTSYTIYSAGERHAKTDGSKRWPGASDEPDPDVVAGYGGTVHLVRWDETAGVIGPFHRPGAGGPMGRGCCRAGSRLGAGARGGGAPVLAGRGILRVLLGGTGATGRHRASDVAAHGRSRRDSPARDCRRRRCSV